MIFYGLGSHGKSPSFHPLFGLFYFSKPLFLWRTRPRRLICLSNSLFSWLICIFLQLVWYVRNCRMFYADLRGTQAASSKKNDDQHLRVYFSSICGCFGLQCFFSSGPMRKLLEASESSGEKKDAGSQHIMLFKILNTWHEISFWNHSNFLTDRSMYIFFGFLFWWFFILYHVKPPLWGNMFFVCQPPKKQN